MDGALRRDGRNVVTPVVVRQLMPEDAKLVVALRSEALTLHPEFFAADPDYEASLPLSQWEQNVAKNFWLLATVGEADAGLCVFSYPAHNRKQAHIGHLGSMYVRDAFRGAGVADALLSAVIDFAAGCVEQVALTVNAENPRAIRFYERHGFRPYGRVPRAIRVGDRYYDDLEMIRPVSASD